MQISDAIVYIFRQKVSDFLPLRKELNSPIPLFGNTNARQSRKGSAGQVFLFFCQPMTAGALRYRSGWPWERSTPSSPRMYTAPEAVLQLPSLFSVTLTAEPSAA